MRPGTAPATTGQMRPGHRDTANPADRRTLFAMPRKAPQWPSSSTTSSPPSRSNSKPSSAPHRRPRNEVKFILKRASDEGRPNLSPDEDVRVNELFLARDRAKANIKGIEAKLEQARKAKSEELEEREAQAQAADTPAAKRRPAYDQAARIGREQRTYNPETDRKGIGFLRDVARNFLFNDAEASHRLAQHMAEERVERGQYLERATGDSTTTNWAGLTVPQYLTDMYAPAVANMRPFADICNKHELPSSGMTVNISQVTTASAGGAAVVAARRPRRRKYRRHPPDRKCPDGGRLGQPRPGRRSTAERASKRSRCRTSSSGTRPRSTRRY